MSKKNEITLKLQNYSLKVGKRQLFNNVNIQFQKKQIHHILGSNGVGKSCFAKSCVGILPHGGEVQKNEEAVLNWKQQ